MSTIKPSKLQEMPLLTISSPKTIQKCAQMKLEPDDIFICSYPKSGTTWTQHILISLLLLHRKLELEENKGDEKRIDDEDEIEYNHVSDFAPFLEIDPHWKDDGDNDDNDDNDDNGKNELIDSIQEKHKLIGRRIFNTHLRCDMLPSIPSEDTERNKNAAKFIYVTRSPLDVCVSFYHHLSNQVEGCYEKSFDNFFQEWMNGEIPFGRWTDHILSYAPYLFNDMDNNAKDVTNETKSTNKQILMISYEDMCDNLHQVLQQLTSFLNLNDYITSQTLKDIEQSFSFDDMKKNLNRFQPKSVTWKNGFKFLRKGKTGDSSNLTTEKQLKQFEHVLKEENFQSIIEEIMVNEKCKRKIMSSLSRSL